MEWTNKKIILLGFLFIFICIVWFEILFNKPSQETEFYFLNVGQGDSEFVVLENNIKILIDGGPSDKALEELSKINSSFNKYIDIVILTHPQQDHFAGLVNILKNYEIGIFIDNGQKGMAKSWKEIEKILKEKNIKRINLSQGDYVKYKDDVLEILAPSKKELLGKDLNEAAIVIKYKSKKISALFTSDIGLKQENELADKFDINVDILKVAHHGSKYSSSEKFLKEATPKISIIEVGKNSYGHPAKDILNRLSQIKSQIFRTDQDGTLKIVLNESKLNILSNK